MLIFRRLTTWQVVIGQLSGLDNTVEFGSTKMMKDFFLFFFLSFFWVVCFLFLCSMGLEDKHCNFEYSDGFLYETLILEKALHDGAL